MLQLNKETFMKSSTRFVPAVRLSFLLAGLIVSAQASAQAAPPATPVDGFVSPMQAPGQNTNISMPQALYQQCAACHGQGGQGDGSQAAGMNPAPVSFKGLPLDRIQKAVVTGVNNAPGHGV